MPGRPHRQWYGTHHVSSNSAAEHQDHSQIPQPKKEKGLLIAVCLISFVPLIGPFVGTLLLAWTSSKKAWSQKIAHRYEGAIFLLLLGILIVGGVFLWKMGGEGDVTWLIKTPIGLSICAVQYGVSLLISFYFQYFAWKVNKNRQNRDSTQDRQAVPLEDLSSSAAEEPPRRSSSRSSRRRDPVNVDVNEDQGVISSSSEVGSPVTRRSPWERLGRRRGSGQGSGNAGDEPRRSRSRSRRISSTRNPFDDPRGSGSLTRPPPTRQNPFDTSEEESPDDRRNTSPAFLGRRKEPASFV